MTIDEVVKSAVLKLLSEQEYITRTNAVAIAQEIADKVYGQFESDMKAINEEMEKMRKREDKIWDIVHQVPPRRFPRLRALFKTICFWKN